MLDSFVETFLINQNFSVHAEFCKRGEIHDIILYDILPISQNSTCDSNSEIGYDQLNWYRGVHW